PRGVGEQRPRGGPRGLPGTVRDAAAAQELLRGADRRARPMIRLTCREVIARLGDYVDAAIDLLMHARVTLHLATCAACRAYLVTYKRTIALVGQNGRVEMPGEARHRVTRELIERRRRDG